MADLHSIDALEPRDKARFIMDMFHRTIMHYALWFTEVRHQMGMEKALETLATASEKSLGIQLKRLGKTLGFDLQDGLPKPLLDLSPEKLDALAETAGVNWLANDGVWFQALEFSAGMNDAKRCNDSCWAHFSPVEAWSIKRFLGLPERSGLAGLKQALGFRLYSQINTHSFTHASEDAFTFEINQCRVQDARKRKGLDDYPCKSAGLVEYAYFARAIDDRIKTECVGCPPDDHPEAWFCAWHFSLDPEQR